MATTFNMLRANDLIWSFVVNNYLLGKDPFPFDLLYWNADATRMPANDAQLLPAQDVSGESAEGPRRVTLCSVPIDLRTIKTPAYFLSDTRRPHRAVEEHLRAPSCCPARCASCWPAPAISPEW